MRFTNLPQSLINDLDAITAQVMEEKAAAIAAALGDKPVTRRRQRKKTPPPAGAAKAVAKAGRKPRRK